MSSSQNLLADGRLEFSVPRKAEISVEGDGVRLRAQTDERGTRRVIVSCTLGLERTDVRRWKEDALQGERPRLGERGGQAV